MSWKISSGPTHLCVHEHIVSAYSTIHEYLVSVYYILSHSVMYDRLTMQQTGHTGGIIAHATAEYIYIYFFKMTDINLLLFFLLWSAVVHL